MFSLSLSLQEICSSNQSYFASLPGRGIQPSFLFFPLEDDIRHTLLFYTLLFFSHPGIFISCNLTILCSVLIHSNRLDNGVIIIPPPSVSARVLCRNRSLKMEALHGEDGPGSFQSNEGGGDEYIHADHHHMKHCRYFLTEMERERESRTRAGGRRKY